MKDDTDLTTKITVPNYTLACRHCGTVHVVRMPCTTEVFEREIRGFQAQHKDCKGAADE